MISLKEPPTQAVAAQHYRDALFAVQNREDDLAAASELRVGDTDWSVYSSGTGQSWPIRLTELLVTALQHSAKEELEKARADLKQKAAALKALLDD